jgi:hypothetical protein
MTKCEDGKNLYGNVIFLQASASLLALDILQPLAQQKSPIHSQKSTKTLLKLSTPLIALPYPGYKIR